MPNSSELELPPLPNIDNLTERKKFNAGNTNTTSPNNTQNITPSVPPVEPVAVPIMPKRKSNKPKLTWKTAAMVAAGIGIGATVFFASGPLGVGIMTMAGGLTNKFLKKAERRAISAGLSEKSKVRSIHEPRSGLRGKINKLKNYIKSPEGLRDIRWMINSAIITGGALTIHSYLSSAMNEPHTIIDNNIQPEYQPDTLVEPQVPQVSQNTLSYDNIKIGDSVGDFNVNVGYDTASYAVNGQNAEMLNSSLINAANSKFNRFYIFNPDGTRTVLDASGTSISDLIAKGYDPKQIAVDIASKNGTSQAWVNVEELIKNGGKSLG